MIKFKEQVKLQKISEDAWIVNDDEKRVGILHKSVQDKYTYLDKTETIPVSYTHLTLPTILLV